MQFLKPGAIANDFCTNCFCCQIVKLKFFSFVSFVCQNPLWHSNSAMNAACQVKRKSRESKLLQFYERDGKYQVC